MTRTEKTTPKITISDDAKKGLKALPEHLCTRYHDWHADAFDAALYADLAKGQAPHSMVISCCDSRVNPTKFFNAESGEFFVHRNIANIVPPCAPKAEHHSTAAALEFAVTVLKVSHIIIIGHSACGGIKGGHAQCGHDAHNTPENMGSFQKWLHLLKPAYERLDQSMPMEEQVDMLEKLSVVVSLENLMGYDFIRTGVADNTLSIHGLWHDIGSGDVQSYNADCGIFERV